MKVKVFFRDEELVFTVENGSWHFLKLMDRIVGTGSMQIVPKEDFTFQVNQLIDLKIVKNQVLHIVEDTSINSFEIGSIIIRDN